MGRHRVNPVGASSAPKDNAMAHMATSVNTPLLTDHPQHQEGFALPLAPQGYQTNEGVRAPGHREGAGPPWPPREYCEVSEGTGP